VIVGWRIPQSPAAFPGPSMIAGLEQLRETGLDYIITTLSARHVVDPARSVDEVAHNSETL